MKARPRDETEADDFFRADAAALGYLRANAHAPGNGRGLYAYYRDFGINPPEWLRRVLPEVEKTVLDSWTGDDDPLVVADIDGRHVSVDGRHTKGGAFHE